VLPNTNFTNTANTQLKTTNTQLIHFQG